MSIVSIVAQLCFPSNLHISLCNTKDKQSSMVSEIVCTRSFSFVGMKFFSKKTVAEKSYSLFML